MGYVRGETFAVLLTERLVPVGWQGVLCEGTGSQLPSRPVPQELSLLGPVPCSRRAPPGDRQGPRWPHIGRDRLYCPRNA